MKASAQGPEAPRVRRLRGEPTNGLVRVEVTLHNLSHANAGDLDILLVSPSGAKIMLMSDAGGTFAVTNATLVFHPNWQGYPAPPKDAVIPPTQETHYRCWNYGDQETQLPGAPVGPYDGELDNLPSTDADPNGIWNLYIYDDTTGRTGVMQGSWALKFYYQ